MPNERVTYSQFGEDVISRNLLRGVPSGFYVDVGAHHPFKFSNTAIFHQLGWNGINVEPNGDAIKLFRLRRPHAINLHAAVHNDLAEVTLHKFKGGLTSTVVAGRARMLASRKNQPKERAGEEVVPALSLNRLFSEYVPEGTQVNYFSIDIEGYDQEALMAFDLERFRPDVLCAELHKYDMLNLGEHPLVRFLHDAGYEPAATSHYSLTFLHRDARQRLGLRG